MKLILKYIKPYWYFALLAPLFMVGEVVADLLQPQFMSNIVDNGILSEVLNIDEKISVVISNGLIMICALIIGGAFGILSAACASACANNFANDLRKDVFSRIVNLSFEQTDKFTTGSLITRITNDITQIQDFVSMAVRMFIRSLSLFVGGMIFMFSVSSAFGLVLAIILPFEIITIIFVLKKVIPLFNVVQGKIDKVNSIVQENVNGARVVKAFTAEEKESNRFNDASVSLANNSYKVFRIMAKMSPIMNIFLYVATIAIIYIGGIKIDENVSMILTNDPNAFTVGEVLKAITYISIILMSVMQLAMLSQQVTRAMISSNRVSEVLNSLPIVCSSEDMQTDSLGTVEFKNLSFAYPNSSGEKVLDDINLKINKGEIIAILGATGCGKSTLVNMIPRFYDADEGDVLVDNISVKNYMLNTLRNKVTIVLQKTELFSGTILDNIKWGKTNATFEEVREISKICQADDFITSFKDGYDTQIGEKGSTLSGGQKQRIAIARGLIRNPEILIFDDSTSALDLETEAKLYKALKTHLKDTTLIIIAQRVASAKNADKICVMDKGKIIRCDTHENLMKDCELYIDIYNSQLKRGEENE